MIPSSPFFFFLSVANTEVEVEKVLLRTEMFQVGKDGIHLSHLQFVVLWLLEQKFLCDRDQNKATIYCSIKDKELTR